MIDDDYSELDELKYTMLVSRFSTSALGLTIAPTSDCNFRCVYCYEKDSVKHPPMSKDIQDKLIEMVSKKAKTIDSLFVSWYGGEPLLAFDVIKRLTTQFKMICDENSIKYSAGMVTNGYFLTQKIAKQFAELSITRVQVTVDGTSANHDKRRPLIGGGPTFETIIGNLQELKGILPFKISLRVNTDKTNINDAKKILSIIIDKDIAAVVSPYLAPVHASNGCCADSICYSNEEFSEIDLQFGLNKTVDKSLVNKYPCVFKNYCGADSQQSYVVDADGKLYKCWNDIGITERAIFDLKINSSENDNVIYEYMLYDAIDDPLCHDCKYLPICRGGCPSFRLSKSNDRCMPVKYKLASYMKQIPQELFVQKAKELDAGLHVER